MTVTEAPPADAPAGEEAPEAPEGWLATADHKRQGLLFVAGSLSFLVVGGVLGAVLRAELARQGVQFGRVDHDRVVSMHATVSTVLFLVPAWIGVATFLVPLQIGAARLAFPRLHAFSLWLFLLGGGLLVSAYLVGRPADMGFVASTPVAGPARGATTATSLAIVSVGLVTVASLLAALSLAVTVLKLRTPGLTLLRLPMFSWATLVTSLATLLSAPVFLAGLTLLYLDQHFGGTLFDPGTVAGKSVWRHTLWLPGRPAVYLLLLPGLGAACDIVATHARRPLLRHPAARTHLFLVAALAFTAWAAGGEAADALVLPTFSVPTALVAVPLGAIVLLLLGTAARSRPRFHVSLLFLAGFLLLTGTGVLNALIAGAVGVDGRAWATAHLHTVAFGAPTMLFFAALYHWAPKLLGRHLTPRLGALAFLGLAGGFLFLGLGGYLLGYDGTPAHAQDFPVTENTSTFAPLAALGAVLVVAGVLAFALDLVYSVALRRGEQAVDDPYEGLTLEWATTSPPPAHNFEAVPEVRSAQPLLDLRTAGGAGHG